VGARVHEHQPAEDGGFRVTSTRSDTPSASSDEQMRANRHAPSCRGVLSWAAGACFLWSGLTTGGTLFFAE
jgi:hypothetical protein